MVADTLSDKKTLEVILGEEIVLQGKNESPYRKECDCNNKDDESYVEVSFFQILFI
jgi:hypothetical protein